MKKIKLLLKSNAGFTNTIEMLGVAIIVSIMTIVSIVMAGYIHNLTVLDRFADEMVAKAALEGKCAGAELDERYEQLAKSTGLRPTITFEAKYYSTARKTVQYGDAITVTAQLELNVVGYGDFYLKDTPIRKSTGQSEQYWKG